MYVCALNDDVYVLDGDERVSDGGAGDVLFGAYASYDAHDALYEHVSCDALP